jgi:predicted RNA-binding protein with RPS1 domain
MFVDVGTLRDGLVHIRDVSQEYFVNNLNHFTPGQEIDVYVKFIVPTGRKKLGLQMFPVSSLPVASVSMTTRNSHVPSTSFTLSSGVSSNGNDGFGDHTGDALGYSWEESKGKEKEELSVVSNSRWKDRAHYLSVKDLHCGMKLPGKVIKASDYGVFVDIGAYDTTAFLHRRRMLSNRRQWRFQPREIVPVGSELLCYVYEVDVPRRRVGVTTYPPEKWRTRLLPPGVSPWRDKQEEDHWDGYSEDNSGVEEHSSVGSASTISGTGLETKMEAGFAREAGNIAGKQLKRSLQESSELAESLLRQRYGRGGDLLRDEDAADEAQGAGGDSEGSGDDDGGDASTYRRKGADPAVAKDKGAKSSLLRGRSDEEDGDDAFGEVLSVEDIQQLSRVSPVPLRSLPTLAVNDRSIPLVGPNGEREGVKDAEKQKKLAGTSLSAGVPVMPVSVVGDDASRNNEHSVADNIPSKRQKMRTKSVDLPMGVVAQVTTKELFQSLARPGSGRRCEYLTLGDIKKWYYVQALLADGKLTLPMLHDLFLASGAKRGVLEEHQFPVFLDKFVSTLGLRDAENSDVEHCSDENSSAVSGVRDENGADEQPHAAPFDLTTMVGVSVMATQPFSAVQLLSPTAAFYDAAATVPMSPVSPVVTRRPTAARRQQVSPIPTRPQPEEAATRKGFPDEMDVGAIQFKGKDPFGDSCTFSNVKKDEEEEEEEEEEVTAQEAFDAVAQGKRLVTLKDLLSWELVHKLMAEVKTHSKDK